MVISGLAFQRRFVLALLVALLSGGMAACGAPIHDEARQRWEGRPPCFTPAGVPYYTPGDMPC